MVKPEIALWRLQHSARIPELSSTSILTSSSHANCTVPMIHCRRRQ